jgi:hypothetical protein
MEMGKVKALKLGIVKGVQHVASVVLPDTYKCPVCKYIFTAHDVALEAKTTGKSAEEIVAGHIKDCIARMYPNSKSECLMCKERGKTTMLKISELDQHIAQCHTDNSESKSGNTEVRTDSGDKSPVSALATERESEKHVDTGEKQ